MPPWGGGYAMESCDARSTQGPSALGPLGAIPMGKVNSRRFPKNSNGTLKNARINMVRDGWKISITSLLQEKMGRKEMNDLYRVRWDIEIQFLARCYCILTDLRGRANVSREKLRKLLSL